MSNLALTQKVLYSANERLDLNDVLAEFDLADKTLANILLGIVSDSSPDGRVFKGWRTSTTTGANVGFTIAAEPAFALTRDGLYLIRDGSTSLSIALVTNAINYIHAYYDETESNVDARRFFIGAAEVTENVATRNTRTAGLYNVTAAVGSPAYSGFQQTANINGAVRQLIPLYAVVVNGSNVVTSVTDFRPMFAPNHGSGNAYESAVPDTPNFSPADAATVGITDMRSALVAIADRIKNIKNTTNWFDDNFNNIVLNAAGSIHSSINTSSVTIAGGNTSSAGANIVLTGGAAGSPNKATYNAVTHLFPSADGGTALSIDATNVIAEMDRYSSTANAEFRFVRYRGTPSSFSGVSQDDILFELSGYQALNSSSTAKTASIQAVADAAAPTASGRLVFSTASAGTFAERMRLNSSGQLLIGTPTSFNVTTSSPLQIRGALYGVRVFSESTTGTDRNHFLAQRFHGVAGAVLSGDVLGGIAFGGRDSSGNLLSGVDGGAEITAWATANWTSSSRTSLLAFSTGAAATPIPRLTIDGVGATAFNNNSSTRTIGSGLQYQFVTQSTNGFAVEKYASQTSGLQVYFRHARNTFVSNDSAPVPLVLVTNDDIANLNFDGHDGTNFVTAAQIKATATGTISTGIVPGALSFFTANSSGALTQALLIDNTQTFSFFGSASFAGNVTPSITLSDDLGSTSKRWRNVWAQALIGVQALLNPASSADVVTRHGYNAVVACGTFTCTSTSNGVNWTLPARYFNISNVFGSFSAPLRMIVVLNQALSADATCIVTTGVSGAANVTCIPVYSSNVDGLGHPGFSVEMVNSSGTDVAPALNQVFRFIVIGSPATLP